MAISGEAGCRGGDCRGCEGWVSTVRQLTTFVADSISHINVHNAIHRKDKEALRCYIQKEGHLLPTTSRHCGCPIVVFSNCQSSLVCSSVLVNWCATYPLFTWSTNSGSDLHHVRPSGSSKPNSGLCCWQAIPELDPLELRKEELQ